MRHGDKPIPLSRRNLVRIGGGALAATPLRSTVARSAPREADLSALSLSEAARRIRAGQTTASELVAACLARSVVYEPKLNTFITLASDLAVHEARAMDAEQRAGKLRGPLHGLPISLKDNIDTSQIRTTGGAPFLKSRVPAEDSTVVARLRAAGAIIIGKNNLNELAMSDGANSYYGRVRNPWALDHETGGSSSGSCAAVAADLVLGAIGTDTGGSVRNPACWCGVVGLKPTNGLVSNRGTVPLSPSLDTIGPITKTVEDAALVLQVMAGYDDLDITSLEHASEDYVVGARQRAAPSASACRSATSI